MQMPNFQAIFFGHAAFSVLLLNLTVMFNGKESPISFTSVPSFIFGLLGLLIWLLSLSTLVAFLIAKAHTLRFPESPFGTRFTALYWSIPGSAMLIPFCLVWNWQLVPALLVVIMQGQPLGPVWKFISLSWIHPAVGNAVLVILFLPAFLSMFIISCYLWSTLLGSCWYVIRGLYRAWKSPAQQKYTGVPTTTTEDEDVDLEAMPPTTSSIGHAPIRRGILVAVIVDG